MLHSRHDSNALVRGDSKCGVVSPSMQLARVVGGASVALLAHSPKLRAAAHIADVTRVFQLHRKFFC